MIFKLRSNRYGVGSCFRPLIRGFFFYAKENNIKDPGTLQPFPSPHSGILFLCDREKERKRLINAAVSVPSFGDSFFIKYEEMRLLDTIATWFPSPHSGILFLSVRAQGQKEHCLRGFRPLIRGFFFYKCEYGLNVSYSSVSVPSFGDSFFISLGNP